MTKAGFSPAGFLAENVGIMSTMMDESLSEPEEVRPEHPPAGADRIESQIMSAEERISRLLPFPISVGLFVCILGAELLLLTAGAIHKPFWYDELFTLYLAKFAHSPYFGGRS